MTITDFQFAAQMLRRSRDANGPDEEAFMVLSAAIATEVLCKAVLFRINPYLAQTPMDKAPTAEQLKRLAEGMSPGMTDAHTVDFPEAVRRIRAVLKLGAKMPHETELKELYKLRNSIAHSGILPTGSSAPLHRLTAINACLTILVAVEQSELSTLATGTPSKLTLESFLRDTESWAGLAELEQQHLDKQNLNALKVEAAIARELFISKHGASRWKVVKDMELEHARVAAKRALELEELDILDDPRLVLKSDCGACDSKHCVALTGYVELEGGETWTPSDEASHPVTDSIATHSPLSGHLIFHGIRSRCVICGTTTSSTAYRPAPNGDLVQTTTLAGISEYEARRILRVADPVVVPRGKPSEVEYLSAYFEAARIASYSEEDFLTWKHDDREL